MTTTTQHLRVTGRVQGVGYRWHMAREARALGLTGWVRNRQDGSVEAQASGPTDAMQALVSTSEAVEPCLGFDQRETV